MSLLVWLPLNGDLTNYGLSQAKFKLVNNSSGLSIGSNGKIGAKMYQRTTATADHIVSDINFNLTADFSMCCWCKLTKYANASSANGIITAHDHNSGGGGLNMYYISDTDYRICLSAGTSGSNRIHSHYYGNTNIYNQWHHLCLTYDSIN